MTDQPDKPVADHELRQQASAIAASYFMATSNDCVALTDKIYKLCRAREQEAANKARFEQMYRVLLSTEGYLFIPKSMLEEPLTTYEITTYDSPLPDQPGVVYRFTQPKGGTQ